MNVKKVTTTKETKEKNIETKICEYSHNRNCSNSDHHHFADVFSHHQYTNRIYF